MTDSPAFRILVQRFLADGSPDTTCNGTGQFIDTANDAVVSDVVVLSDGSFIVAGTIQINNKGTLFLAKFTSTCEIDDSFGDGSFSNGGFATYSSDNSTAGTALAVQSNGSIIVAGYENDISDGGAQRILVTRFTPSGILDNNSFGSNGRLTPSISEDGRALDVIIDSDGRIIFAGLVIGPSGQEMAIVGRLTSDGRLDSTFDIKGYLIDDFDGEARLNAIAIRPNGNLVAVGTYGGTVPFTQQSPIVVCLTQSGVFDTACGAQGWRYFPTINRDDFGDDVFVTADNKTLISGISDGGSPEPIVMRLDDTGAVDSDFATSGTWNGSPFNDRLHAVSVQSDGRVIAAGAFNAQGILNLAVVRLANTVTLPTTTTTTTIVAVTTSTMVANSIATTTIPLVVTTTLAPDQLPETGQQVNVLTVPVALFGLGILLLGMRRRALR